MGDMVMVPVETTSNFGRIAAQTAKQVILQRIREAERESLYDEFVEREGDLVTGTVQSVTSGAITLSLGRAEAVMPRAQQIPGERYRPHDKVRAYVVEVKKNRRGPQIVVSRAHKNMLRRLLEYEVPEIYNGQVEIKNIAREAGHRSKVAVAALQEGVDPGGRVRGHARHPHSEHRQGTERRKDRRDRVERRSGGVYRQGAQPGARQRYAARRRFRHRAHGDRDRARRSAFAGDWARRAECASGRQADRLAHRHQERLRSRDWKPLRCWTSRR